MTDAVEVAIESALLEHLQALTLSPAIDVAYPNKLFTPPTPSKTACWLRATLLPADTFALGIDYGASNQHYGILQVDTFYGIGGGELAPSRIMAQVAAHFKRGTKLTKDGFTIEVTQPPFRGRSITDANWMMVPLSIPYLSFAANPA